VANQLWSGDLDLAPGHFSWQSGANSHKTSGGGGGTHVLTPRRIQVCSGASTAAPYSLTVFPTVFPHLKTVFRIVSHLYLYSYFVSCHPRLFPPPLTSIFRFHLQHAAARARLSRFSSSPANSPTGRGGDPAPGWRSRWCAPPSMLEGDESPFGSPRSRAEIYRRGRVILGEATKRDLTRFLRRRKCECVYLLMLMCISVS
jgi:hypothetical protein